MLGSCIWFSLFPSVGAKSVCSSHVAQLIKTLRLLPHYFFDSDVSIHLQWNVAKSFAMKLVIKQHITVL